MNPNTFVASLAQMRLPAVFNPYADCCDVHDRQTLPRLRKKNLELFLEAALGSKVDTIWVARDLGYRGGRRTGVPLTDEVHLGRVGTLLGGHRAATRDARAGGRRADSRRRLEGARAHPPAGRALERLSFHPHEPGDPFSNRCHTAAERT